MGAAGALLVVLMGAAGSGAEGLVDALLGSRPDLFGRVLERVEEHQVQVLYTQIDRLPDNKPSFTSHAFRVDRDAYFYPASAVKVAGALLALEKLRALGVEGLDKDAPLRIDPAWEGQQAVLGDPSAPGGQPSIGHYIHKLFLVSDNDAYNRLYEFVGQQRLNEGLWEKGYADVRLVHRLATFNTPEENRRTNPFTFFRDGRIIYQQGLQVNEYDYRARAPIPRGKGHLEGGRLVRQPMDFFGRNYMSVEVLQGLLRAALFPESLPPEQRFDLSEEDYRFLYRAMSMRPRESRHPRYDAQRYPDGYDLFFLYGDARERIPDHVRLFNKAGMAYGYLVDNAYVVDFEAGVEFLLTAAILVNEDGIFNDGVYEYERVGIPFMADLGRIVYAHELGRPRARRPDLSRFALNYGE